MRLPRRPFAAGAVAILHLARLSGAIRVCRCFDHPPSALVDQGVDLSGSHCVCVLRSVDDVRFEVFICCRERLVVMMVRWMR